MAPRETFWSDERLERLMRAIADPAKLSGSQVADAVGDGCTRSMISGATRRRGLILPRNLVDFPRKPKSTLPRKPRMQKPINNQPVIEVVDNPPIPIEDADIPREQLKTLIELGRNECHWAVNDGSPFLFCGAYTDAYPYCVFHWRRAYKLRAPIEMLQ